MSINGITSTHELSKLVGIPQPTLHHLLSGITSKPRAKLVNALASYFSISVEQLIGDVPLPITLPDDVKKNFGVREASVITWHEIKNWPTVDKTNLKKIIVESKVSEHCFAVTLDDDKHEPAFSSGTTLIFDTCLSPKDRNFALVSFFDNNEVLFGKIFKENENFYIAQRNQTGEIILKKITSSKDNIIGILVESRITY